jgi:hypothetical protein
LPAKPDPFCLRSKQHPVVCTLSAPPMTQLNDLQASGPDPGLPGDFHRGRGRDA